MALDAERDELERADREAFVASATLSLVINWVATEEKTAVFIQGCNHGQDFDKEGGLPTEITC